MLWDPFLYCINDSIQGNSETGNKVFVLPSKVAINIQSRVFTAKCSEPQVGISNGMDGESGVAKFLSLRTET